MLYFISENTLPLKHVSSGKLINREHFIHSHRKLNTFVVLICIEGTLYIAQNDVKYELKPNQFLILFAGYEHYGYAESENELSYYWCHFQVPDDQYQIVNSRDYPDELIRFNDDIEKNISNYYILPEYGNIESYSRTNLEFRQLLDLVKRRSYPDYFLDYALSLLTIEISQEFIEKYLSGYNNDKKAGSNINEIKEWIRINYSMDLSVKKIAGMFNYNPDYLSTAFKNHTGLPLLKYLNQTRISMAKKLLLNSSLRINEISYLAGFKDVKNFMKLFKRNEEITPSQYRNAFSQTKMNKK